VRLTDSKDHAPHLACVGNLADHLLQKRVMTGAFVRATALASALGPDLEAAVERLAGAPSPRPETRRRRNLALFSRIPHRRERLEKTRRTIARSVAEDFAARGRARSARWADLPCIVGSSSFFRGRMGRRRLAALEPFVRILPQLARGLACTGPVTAVSTTCTSGLSVARHRARPRRRRRIAATALYCRVEFSSRLTVAGFAGLETAFGDHRASPAGPQPQRDGLVLGEALAAVLVSAASAPLAG